MPGHHHFLSGLMVATALMQLDAFQIEAGVSLWMFTHATHSAIAYSYAVQSLSMISVCQEVLLRRKVPIEFYWSHFTSV